MADIEEIATRLRRIETRQIAQMEAAGLETPRQQPSVVQGHMVLRSSHTMLSTILRLMADQELTSVELVQDGKTIATLNRRAGL